VANNETKLIISATDATRAGIDSAKRNLGGLSSAASDIARIFGVGFSAAAFLGIVKGSIDAADHLNDLSKSTHISVEELSGLSLAANQSGADIDSVAKAVNKLSKNIGDSPDIYKKLGITAKDNLGALGQVSDIFNQITDEHLQASFAAKALGKEWQGSAPLLAEGSKRIQEMVDKGASLSGITKESAEAADEFNDRIDELKFSFGGLITQGIGPLLPQLIDTIKYLNGTGGEARGAAGDVHLLQTAFQAIVIFGANVNYVLKQTGNEIGGIAAQMNALGHGDIKSFNVISEAMKKDAAAARKELDNFEQKILNPSSGKAKVTSQPDTKKTDPALQSKLRAFLDTGKDDPTKKLLDNILKNLENGIAREKDLLDSRNKFIDLYNSENLISISDYYKAKNAAQDENLAKSIAGYDKEIAALQKFKKGANNVESAEAQGKINDLLEKKAKAQNEAAQQTIINSVEEQKSLREYQDSIKDVNAQVLELTGHLKEAAVIRFDQQNESLKKRFSIQGNQAALDQLETLRKYAIAQAESNKLNEDASLIQNQLANAEDRINISRQVGATSELASLVSISAAREKSADALEHVVVDFEALAQASGNPKLLQDADNLRLKLEELRASGDLLAKKFDTIFKDSFANAFTDFITGSKSAADAFKSFADSVVQQITRIVAEDLANKLFENMGGGGGGASFIGSFFSNLLGGGKAIGGDVSAGKLYEVGEGDRSEMFMYGGKQYLIPGNNGSIVPNSQLQSAGQSIRVTNHFAITGAVDSRSQSQIAAEVGAAVNRALRRNR
jgi:hypothetical protein